MTARRRRVLLLLLTSMFLAFAGSLPGGARYLIPAADLTPIDRPGPEIPIISTLAPNPTPAGVPTQPPVFTVVPNFPLPTIPQISTLAPNPPIPTATLVPIFPIETEEPTAAPPATVPPTTAVPPTVVTGFGNLTIYNRTCDNQGFNPYFTVELKKLLAECPVSDREFTFTLVNSTVGYTKTVTTKGGMLTETVPSPAIGFQRADVAGYDLSNLSCSNDPFNKDRAKSIAHYAGTDIAPGENVTCYWFNVLASTDVGIAFDAVACPAVPPLTTPSVTLTVSDLTCTWPPLAGLTYTLADDKPSTKDKVAFSDPDPATYHTAQFIDLPPGKYTITLTPPPGATHAYVPECSTGFSGPSSFTPPVVTGTGFTFTLTADAPGETYHCRWYVVKP